MLVSTFQPQPLFTYQLIVTEKSAETYYKWAYKGFLRH